MDQEALEELIAEQAAQSAVLTILTRTCATISAEITNRDPQRVVSGWEDAGNEMLSRLVLAGFDAEETERTINKAQHRLSEIMGSAFSGSRPE